MSRKIAVFRKEHFNAAHRLFNPDWDNDRNAAVFGKCSNANYHGHNYELIVKVTGVPDVVTGFVMDMKELSDLVKENVLVKLDHRNLNLDTEYFKNINPTAENICFLIYDILRPLIREDLDLSVRLYETERNFVEFPA